MNKVNIFGDIKGMELPARRRTKVILGDNGAIKGDLFCQGYMMIYPGGGIPEHHHETVESYAILEGGGEMTVDGETTSLKRGDVVSVEKNKSHELRNTGKTDMHMMFVYAPKIIVDHWAEEQSGKLK